MFPTILDMKNDNNRTFLIARNIECLIIMSVAAILSNAYHAEY